MIYIDFYSGSHGHFLEYITNTWLFKGPRVPNLFTNLGTSHGIKMHAAYIKDHIAHCGHYSEFNKPVRDPKKIIRITINQDWAKWIYQINVVARAGDIPLEKKILAIPESIRHNPASLRNNWYAKFNSEDSCYRLPTNWTDFKVPVFEFPMESLFDLKDFYSTLYKLAEFLEITFTPDIELAKVFNGFLEKNQGWQYYKQSCNIVENSLAGNCVEFSSNEIVQALINSILSKSVGLFDGELFDADKYPTSTDKIWDNVNQHLITFDSKF